MSWHSMPRHRHCCRSGDSCGYLSNALVFGSHILRCELIRQSSPTLHLRPQERSIATARLTHSSHLSHLSILIAYAGTVIATLPRRYRSGSRNPGSDDELQAQLLSALGYLSCRMHLVILSYCLILEVEAEWTQRFAFLRPSVSTVISMN